MNSFVKHTAQNPNPKLAVEDDNVNHTQGSNAVFVSSPAENNPVGSPGRDISVDDPMSDATATMETSFSMPSHVRPRADFADSLTELLEHIPASDQGPANPVDNSTSDTTVNAMEIDSEYSKESEPNLIEKPTNKPLERVKGNLPPICIRRSGRNSDEDKAIRTMNSVFLHLSFF